MVLLLLVVPADGRLRDSTQIVVDESSLTGESFPLDRRVDGPEDDGWLWAGTTVLSGSAKFEVTATGTATRYGRIGRLVAESLQPPTPLQRSLGR